MSEVSQEELQASINELIKYRDRLKTEVVTVSQKLQMSKKRIESVLKENPELCAIENLLSKLISQRDKTSPE